MISSSIEQFLSGQFLVKVKADLAAHRIFSKEDLKGISYYHCRRYFLALPNWIVRCGLNIQGRMIDIGIFHNLELKVLLQVEYGLISGQPNFFPEELFNQSLRTLVDCQKFLKKVAYCYFLYVFDTEVVWFFPKPIEKHCFFNLPINIRDFPDYQKWRRTWEELKSKVY